MSCHVCFCMQQIEFKYLQSTFLTITGYYYFGTENSLEVSKTYFANAIEFLLTHIPVVHCLIPYDECFNRFCHFCSIYSGANAMRNMFTFHHMLFEFTVNNYYSVKIWSHFRELRFPVCLCCLFILCPYFFHPYILCYEISRMT